MPYELLILAVALLLGTCITALLVHPIMRIANRRLERR